MEVAQTQEQPRSMDPGWFVRWRLAAQRGSVLQLQSLSARFASRATKPSHLRVGERGELEALFFLRRQGYVIVARRWRSPELRGDLDLVGWEGDTLCFVEVKTRSARDRTPAALAIDEGKRRTLAQMARGYLRTLPREERRTVLTRVDIVSVYLSPLGVECELIRDAFDWRRSG